MGLNETRRAQTTGLALEAELLPMKAPLLLLKKCLFSMGGMMALAAVSVSGTVPTFVRMAAQRDSALEAKPVANDAQTSPVVAAHGARSRSTAISKPVSPGSKTKKGVDRKSMQATVALTGCKDQGLADGVTAAHGKNNGSVRNSNNSKEKSLCSPESPRSR